MVGQSQSNSPQVGMVHPMQGGQNQQQPQTPPPPPPPGGGSSMYGQVELMNMPRKYIHCI